MRLGKRRMVRMIADDVDTCFLILLFSCLEEFKESRRGRSFIRIIF